MKPKTKIILWALLVGIVLGSAFVGSYWLASSIQSVVPDVVIDKFRIESDARDDLLQGWNAYPRNEWVYCGSGHWDGDTYVVTDGRFATVYDSSWFSASFEPCASPALIHPHYNGACGLSSDDLYSFGSMSKVRFMGVLCSPNVAFMYSVDDLNSPMKVMLT